MSTEYALLFICIALQTPVILWELRKEPREIVRNYPKDVQREMTMPFSKGWQAKIDPSDLEKIQRHRRIRLMLFRSCNMLPVLLLFVYLWVKYVDMSRLF